MIVGIGIDLVFIPRMARIVARWDERFLERVFSPEERAYCLRFRNPAPSLAARFGAKEAFYKAIARGRRLPLGFRDAEVVFEPDQTLSLRLSPLAQEICADSRVSRIHLSLTHDGDYASAFVVLEGN